MRFQRILLFFIFCSTLVFSFENEALVIAGEHVVSLRDVQVRYYLNHPQDFQKRKALLFTKKEKRKYAKEYLLRLLADEENKIFKRVSVSREEVLKLNEQLKKYFGSESFQVFKKELELSDEDLNFIFRNELIYQKSVQKSESEKAWQKILLRRYSPRYFSFKDSKKLKK